MPPPDVPSTTEIPLSREEKERLLQKMYSLPHWIAVIRLFGYQTLPMDQAREEIKPIAKEFGKEKVADACQFLVEIVPGNAPLAKLNSHIRRMAFQILGPEAPASISEADTPPSVMTVASVNRTGHPRFTPTLLPLLPFASFLRPLLFQ